MEDKEAFYNTVVGLIDSEGHVRRSARIIEIGMKDKPLLEAIVAELNRRGIKASGPRDSKVPIIEIKTNETARPIIEKMLNPEKRLMAMGALVPDNLIRSTIYRKALHKLLRLIENKRKLPKQKCLACAKTVLREVKALASTGSTPAETRGEARTPPLHLSQYSTPLLNEYIIDIGQPLRKSLKPGPLVAIRPKWGLLLWGRRLAWQDAGLGPPWSGVRIPAAPSYQIHYKFP